MELPLDKFASNEEIYFYWYCQDLLRNGMISKFEYEPKPFTMGVTDYESVEVQMKTMTKLKDRVFVRQRDYTCDFKLYWTEKAYMVLCRAIGLPVKKDVFFIANPTDEGLISYVEIKPWFDQNGETAKARIKCDWVWFQHKVYVQVVIPYPKVDIRGKQTPASSLFPNTFTPLRYFRTDGGGADRKIKWKTKTIEEFINT